MYTKKRACFAYKYTGSKKIQKGNKNNKKG